MARFSEKLRQNVDGEFFVDASCIDCDTCRQLAPLVFGRTDDSEQSYVYHQPANDDEKQQALLSLVACPTSSIGTRNKQDVRSVSRMFPLQLEGNVYYCGFT